MYRCIGRVVPGRKVLFAIQEERLTREKGCVGFPMKAVQYCLKAHGIDARSIDHVCFSNLGSVIGESRESLLSYYAIRARSWPQLILDGEISYAFARLAGMFPGACRRLGSARKVVRRTATTNPVVERSWRVVASMGFLSAAFITIRTMRRPPTTACGRIGMSRIWYSRWTAGATMPVPMCIWLRMGRSGCWPPRPRATRWEYLRGCDAPAGHAAARA